jgi:hypothetical protein
MEITTTISKGEKIAVPLLRMVWDATFPKATTKLQNDPHFNRLKGWTVPLLRKVLDRHRPKPMEIYGNDRHSPKFYHHLNLIKGANIATPPHQDAAGWNPP